MFNYIIIGAGFSGSVIAERIANVLNQKVLIIEKRNHIGGNCYDYKDENNIIVHKYGPHLFHTDYKDVFDYLSNFTDWQMYQHRVLVFFDGKNVPIPYNRVLERAAVPQEEDIEREIRAIVKGVY